MKLRAFTLIELSVCISITAILVPLVWLLALDIEQTQHDALERARAARSMRTLSEALRADLHTHAAGPSTTLVLDGPGPCRRVRYLLEGDAITRVPEGAGCAPQTLARGVTRFERRGALVEVAFGRSVFHFGLPGAP